MTVHPRSIAAIVDEAQQLPVEDQLQFLRQACATDSKLYESAVAELQSRPHSRQHWFESGVSEGETEDEAEPSREVIADADGQRPPEHPWLDAHGFHHIAR